MDFLENLPPLPLPPRLNRESHFRFLGNIIALNLEINEISVQTENNEFIIIHYDDIIDWEIGDDVFYAIRDDDTVYWNIRREPE